MKKTYTNRQKSDRRDQRSNNQRHSNVDEIAQEIVEKINVLEGGLQYYAVRELVQDSEKFGPALKVQRLETNQIRKFLDAINQIKSKMTKAYGKLNKKNKERNVDRKKLSSEEIDAMIFEIIEEDIVLLKPKLAYAAARQRAVKPLNRVMAMAIDKVENIKDFVRLIQLLESIIAYHKEEGGR